MRPLLLSIEVDLKDVDVEDAAWLRRVSRAASSDADSDVMPEVGVTPRLKNVKPALGGADGVCSLLEALSGKNLKECFGAESGASRIMEKIFSSSSLTSSE